MTNTPPPERTLEQRQEALGQALEARRVRADVKTSIRNGETTVGEVLAQAKTNRVIGRMKIVDLLEAIDGIGPVRALAALDAADVNHDDRLDQLGHVQLEELTAALG